MAKKNSKTMMIIGGAGLLGLYLLLNKKKETNLLPDPVALPAEPPKLDTPLGVKPLPVPVPISIPTVPEVIINKPQLPAPTRPQYPTQQAPERPLFVEPKPIIIPRTLPEYPQLPGPINTGVVPPMYQPYPVPSELPSKGFTSKTDMQLPNIFGF